MINNYSIKLYKFLILLEQPKRYNQILELTQLHNSSITIIIKVLLRENIINKKEKEYMLKRFYVYELTDKGNNILSHLRILFNEVN
jgi:DNA-binding MarR family transcriptional regulator